MTENCMELVKFGLTKTYGASLYNTSDYASDSVALFLYLRYESLHFGSFLRVRTTHSICLCDAEVVFLIVTIKTNISNL